MFLAVLKRLWSSDIIFGSVEAIADIVLSISWTAVYDSENIGYLMVKTSIRELENSKSIEKLETL